MAVFPVPNTFCEVTYDSDWYEDDRHLTPYRYSLLRSDSDSNSDTVSLTLPSYTYYEYLRSLYDCRTTATGRVPPGYAGSSREHLFENPERAKTWHAFGKDTGSDLSRAAIRSEPTKIRPTYPFPSLHLIQQGGDSADEYDEEFAVTDRSKQKLVWMDALNKWVPETQLHPKPYMTFIGNAPVIEKVGGTRQKEPCGGGGGETEDIHVCERFEVHMGKLANVTRPPPNIQRNNEKRDAIRKRAQELAEQRKQRKAYSSPLYTSLTDRSKINTGNQKRAQSSKAAHKAPPSPVQQRETPKPPPKEAWQPNEGDKPRVQTAPPPPVIPTKKEISITLVKAEEPVDQTDAAKTDKKVKFVEERKPPIEKPKSPKKKKDPDEISKEELEARLAQQRLKESLEKQRQQQALEQQRILKERELEKERERKEKLRLEEQERLKKLKSLEKRPLSQKSSNHDNYYENTMSAADHLFSHKDQSETQKENQANVKLCKVDKPAESKNKKKSQLTPVPKKVKDKNAANKNTPIVNEEQKLDTDVTSMDNANFKENVKDTQAKTQIKQKSSKIGLVKVADPADKVVKEVAPDPVSRGSRGQGRTQKGKAKPQKPKPVKIEKAPSKTISQEQIKPKKGLLKRENTFPPLKSSKTLKLNDTKRKPSRQTTRQFKEVTQTTPRHKPVLAGMGKPPLTIPALSPRTNGPVKKEIPLPISAPSEIKLDDVEIEEPKPPSAHRERRKSIVHQRDIVKKERREIRKCVKKEEEEVPEKLPEIEVDVRKVESWIYGAEDFSVKQTENTNKPEVQAEALPSLTQDLNPELIEKKKEFKEKRRKSVLAKLINTENSVKKWRKPGKDNSYLDELRRLELAEERRKKQMEMYERLKNKRHSLFDYTGEDGSSSFDDYGFLAKYCIFSKGDMNMYRYAFDAVDDTKTGFLEGEDVMIALRGVNNKLSQAEEEYLYRVLELTGYKITNGADFKMFSVLAALSQKISALDKWMKNVIGRMDFKQLESKMFKCKTLWECNVDHETNCIPLDQLCVELRAGGVSVEHENECREKLAHLPALDLLDFLTYVPLFIMIHESVVENPFDESRSK